MSNEVKRFTIESWEGHWPTEVDHGDYVLYSDFEKLRVERDAERSDFTKILSDASDQVDTYAKGIKELQSKVDALEAEVEFHKCRECSKVEESHKLIQTKLSKAVSALKRYKEISIDARQELFTTSEYVAKNTLAELNEGDKSE